MLNQNYAGGDTQSRILRAVYLDGKKPVVSRPYNDCPPILFNQCRFCAVDEHRRQISIFGIKAGSCSICFFREA